MNMCFHFQSDDEKEDEVAVLNVEENKWMMKKVKPVSNRCNIRVRSVCYLQGEPL